MSSPRTAWRSRTATSDSKQVADVMALGVVEDLELVEIDEETARPRLASRRSASSVSRSRLRSIARLGSLVSGS